MTYFDSELETMDPASLRRHQEGRLISLMAALPESKFYRSKLRTAGCRASKVKDLGALTKLPFTLKSELLDTQQEDPPYGAIPTGQLASYRYLHRTSGTSGSPLFWLDNDDDWETWMRCWGHVYRGAGVGEGDVVYCAFSFGPYISHWTALEGARRVGARALPGSGVSSLHRLEAIFEHSATVVLSTPTYALHLGEVAKEHGLDLASSTVNTTIHAGEPGASVPGVKSRIEAMWGARCFDHAGATEVGAWAFACRESPLAMHLNELEFLFECLNPKTLQPVAEGERGELVITTLGRNGMPVVRYRTGDLVQIIREPCPCGRTLARIPGGVLGRADDMMIVRGVNLYPSAIDDVMRSTADVVEYEVEIRGAEGLDELRIKVEVETGSWAEVSTQIKKAFRARFNLRIDLVEAAEASQPRYELKARRYKRITGS